MLTIITTLAALAALTSGIAIPQITTGSGILPPFPTNTTVMYYLVGGWPNTDRMCLDNVANGTLQTGECTCLDYAGLGIAQAPNNTCSLTVYEGTSTCSGATQVSTTQIPSGDSVVCIDMDVDAGKEASGVWDCR